MIWPRLWRKSSKIQENLKMNRMSPTFRTIRKIKKIKLICKLTDSKSCTVSLIVTLIVQVKRALRVARKLTQSWSRSEMRQMGWGRLQKLFSRCSWTVFYTMRPVLRHRWSSSMSKVSVRKSRPDHLKSWASGMAPQAPKRHSSSPGLRCYGIQWTNKRSKTVKMGTTCSIL